MFLTNMVYLGRIEGSLVEKEKNRVIAESTIACADCLEWLPTLEADSIDSCVTDPPYGIKFMDKDWDRGVPGVHFWQEIYRVLKPGAHLLAFGGTRMYHRLVCAIEDAGFEIRDTIAWMYGSGFPKSLDVSKAIDKAAGAKREVVGRKADPRYLYPATETSGSPLGHCAPRKNAIQGFAEAGFPTAPATPEAIQWDGWGTALKPAVELVAVCRKPLSEKTVAENVLRHGTGAINVGGCRIPSNGQPVTINTWDDGAKPFGGGAGHSYTGRQQEGRWPANLVLDEDAARELDEIVGERVGGYGGPSRFFYCAKASRKEKEAGCGGLDVQHVTCRPDSDDEDKRTIQERLHGRRARNFHPTVKPLALLRWLCRLVTPPGGVVLDPFAGSGSTLIAAGLEGFGYLGCEKEEEYVRIATARLAHWKEAKSER